MEGSHPSPALSLPLSSPSRHQPARCSIYTGHFLWEQYYPGGKLGLEGGVGWGAPVLLAQRQADSGVMVKVGRGEGS